MGELNISDIRMLKKTIATSLRNICASVLLFSDELMSQNMYNLNYSQRAELLGDLFPDAEIILFLRYQTDWLKSVYKQALQGGDVLSVKDFFRFDRSSKLSDNPTTDIYNSKITVDPLKLDLTDMVKTYQGIFGKERTHIYFHENFKKDKDNGIKMLCNTIGLKPPNLTSDKIVNRSYSALACMLTLKLYQSADVMHMKFLLPNSNIFYKHMVKTIRSSSFPKNTRLNLLEIRKDFLDWQFVKNNMNKGEIVEIFLRKSFRRIRFFNIWRFIMQKVLDKIIYIDWEIFETGNIKKMLDKHYYEHNKQFLELLAPEELPKEYVKQR